MENGLQSYENNVPLRFDGCFNDIHRQRLHWIKDTGRLSYEQMARIIGCHSVTIRNWTVGQVKECKGLFLLELRVLFNGGLDKLILQAGRSYREMEEKLFRTGMSMKSRKRRMAAIEKQLTRQNG